MLGLDEKIQKTVDMDRFLELESALDDRVHIKKFTLLQKQVRDTIKFRDFETYKTEITQELGNIND